MRNRAIVTSALPYSNGEIHIGHVASTYLPADVTIKKSTYNKMLVAIVGIVAIAAFFGGYSIGTFDDSGLTDEQLKEILSEIKTAPTPPSITPPADQTFEATATLTPLTQAEYGTATASDIFTPVNVTSDAPATFPLGDTIITWTATDSSGNTATATQSVTISDNTAPTLTVPSDNTTHATGIDGAQVIYSVESASDLVDGDITPICNPQSGAVFPIGSTVVTCSARDSSGNLATASFSVIIFNNNPVAVDDQKTIVKNTVAIINVLGNDTDADDDALSIISVTQPANGQVTFTSQSVTYTPNSGFVGNDLFTYTISDPAGGTDTGEVTVTVLDELDIIPVTIDIKPDGDPSSVACKKTNGGVPVAVFGADNFDVSTIDLDSLQLNGVDVTEIHNKIHIEDKNGDEFPDAVLHLDKAGVCDGTSNEFNYPLKESADATLTGSNADGDFEGIGDIRITNR